MSGYDADIAKALHAAGRAFEVFNAGLAAYQADVTRARWTEADGERANLHAALDEWLDGFGVAHKLLERARRDAG